MPYQVRCALLNDVSQLEQLLRDYLRETYNGSWVGTTEQLRQDGFGSEFEILIAETTARETIGFAAWSKSYDLKFCMKGGEIIDLFVSVPHRGRGVALLLVTEAASRIRARGGTYLKGGAVDDERVRRLYARSARSYGGNEYYVSARAFRQLADLSGKTVREIVKNLPAQSWNDEP